MKKILIIRFSSFGDIVLTFPFINSVKKSFPDTEIHFLTKLVYSDLTALHTGIDSTITFSNDSLTDLRKTIKENKYDFIFDIHNNLRSRFVTFFTNTKVLRYRKNNFKKLFYIVFGKNLFKSIIPVYEKYILAGKIVFKDLSTDYSTSDLKTGEGKTFDSKYFVLAPSSKHFTKTLPSDKFYGIIKNYPYKKFIITGSDNETDRKICSEIESAFANVTNLCGKTDYKELARIVKYSEGVICNDSGLLHLAESLGKKVIVFFGSTVKEFGFFPQLKSTEVYEINNLKCRPCTHIGKSYCPKGHFKCMNEININEIRL